MITRSTLAPTRRQFVAGASAAAAVAVGRCAWGQPLGRPRLVVFPGTSRDDDRPRRFLTAMRDLGYVEGRDFTIDLRPAPSTAEAMRRIIDLAPDVIITSSNLPARLAAQGTSSIPIVGAVLGEDFAIELVGPDFSRPRANVTGIGSPGNVAVLGKLWELARELAPAADAIGLIGTEAQVPQFDQFVGAAAGSRVRFAFRAYMDGDHASFLAAFQGLIRERVGITLALAPSQLDAVAATVALSHAARVPILLQRIEWVEAGALISYGPENRDNYARAASFVDRLFRGALVSDLPYETDLQYRLAINLKTARELNFAIPPLLLARADVVIE